MVIIFARFILIYYRGGGYDEDGNLFGADFTTFWTASLQVLSGHAAEVYVPELHHAIEQQYLRSGYEAFFYPPTMLIVCLPLAIVPYFASYIAFLGTTAALFVASIWRILQSPRSLIAILAYPPVYFNIVAGQNAFLTTVILGCGLGIMNRRPGLAGAILGLMVIKPHLSLAVPIALIATGRWRTLAWAGISSALLVVLSYLIFGLDTWLNFLDVSRSARQTLENGDVGFWRLQSIFATMRLLGASASTAFLIHGLAALGVVGAVVWTLRQKIDAAAERSIIALACLLITPFSLFYDMLIMALPLAWMLREWQRTGFPAWSRAVLSLAFLAPMVFYLPVIYGFHVGTSLPYGATIAALFGWFLVREAITAPDHASAPPSDTKARR
ncbi:glycosyltransferase family 87 protein [Bradyrhizobium embrapense]